MRSASRGVIFGLFHQGGRPLPSLTMRTSVMSKRVTMKLSGPAASKPSITPDRIPVMRAAMVTTTATPMATPRIVSPVRILLVRMADRAIRMPSSRVFRRPFISLVPQGDHRIELGCPSRWVDSRDDPDPHSQRHAQSDPFGSHGCGQG